MVTGQATSVAEATILRPTTMSATFRFSVPRIVAFAAAGGLSVLSALGVAATTRPPLAIRGYDPVAYFTVGEPVLGNPNHSYVWAGVRWQFVDGEHQAKFAADPERFMPRIHRFCGLAPAVEPGDAAVNPLAWAIIDGRLHLNRLRSDGTSAVPLPADTL